ncbi:hypothetical protein HGRIS_006289 [Hohenbuehelia grisea]|uniref:Ricin B lectin domain-containing protein n=1 Tax=Hohenbuehelia grisea TaxID=104357 RepID=A0ABR3JZP5_9AGAR
MSLRGHHTNYPDLQHNKASITITFMYFRTLIALSVVSAVVALPALYERAPVSSVTAAPTATTPAPLRRPASTSSSASVTSSSAAPPPPAPKGVEIHPNGNTKKCLDVQGNVRENGTPVQIYDCNGTGAQKWVLNSANTKVQLAGTNFCLDAGTTPKSGVGMKIWTCYDNLPAQAWYYTDDKRIAVTGKGQCLDLAGGSLTNGNRVQTWQCTDGNTNQIWT